MKLAATVIIYRPNYEVISNIETYATKVNIVYVIDNSESINEDVVAHIKLFSTVKYKAFHENRGIAYALNYALLKAKKDGYTHLLTMDQDSKFINEEARLYQKKAESLFSKNDKLILCGINRSDHVCRNKDSIEVVNEVITSGMILDIEKTIKIGGFLDKLFIDYVDYELCYRSHREGYECMIINDCYMLHQIGGIKPIRKLGISFNNHNAHGKIRMYYLIRNGMYVMKKYNEVIFRIIKNIGKIIVKTLLVEDDKINKFRYMYYGFYDFVHDNYGKISIDDR